MDAATEDDLRAALLSVVPEDLDATGFRARLDRVILQGTPPPNEIVPIELPERSTDAGVARRRPRTALAATLAACAAAAAAIVVAALPHGHRTGTAATSGAAVPPAVRAMLFPGTTVLRTYVGRGPRTFAIAPRTIPAHFEYVAYGTCHGSGSLTISETTNDTCARGGDRAPISMSGAVEHGRLIVTADRATSWQVTLTLSPQVRTNAELSSPVDADMHGPDNAVRRSGRGNGTARFAAAPSGAGFTTYEVHLVCHGTGVTLPALSALSAPGAKSLVTKTCFADHEYRWTGVRLTLPAAIDVRAAPDTTWTIVIDGV